MTRDASPTTSQPAEPVQRRPADAVWFAVLAASVATGIGMTIFAPVGDDPPAPVVSTAPSSSLSLEVPTTGLVTTQPATAPATETPASPATAPAP